MYHLIAFLFISIGYITRYSIKNYISTLLFILPFVLILSFMGFIFYLYNFGGRSDWLEDTVIKVVFFPSSILFVKAMLSFVSFYDITQLPISETRRSDLIVIRSLLVRGNLGMTRLKWYLDSYPQHKSDGIFNNKIPKYGALILATYFYLYNKAEVNYFLIDNRNIHLKRKK